MLNYAFWFIKFSILSHFTGYSNLQRWHKLTNELMTSAFHQTKQLITTD